MKALVLAAGLGSRLRPLTDEHPKPLLPIRGLPILGHTLRRLAAAGCEAAAINLHHRGEAIRDHFGSSFEGMPLVYSDEPELLGTLGALYPLRDFFAGSSAVVLINGDSLCRWPLRRLLESHRRGRRPVTLLLTRYPDPRKFGGGVGIDGKGRVVSFRPGDGDPGGTVAERLVFAGAHVLAPELLERVGPGPSDSVRDLYDPLLREGKEIGAVISTGPWHDLGTPQRFLEAAGRRVLLFPGARVGMGSLLRDVLVGFDVDVPAGSRFESCLLTRTASGFLATPFREDGR